MEGVFWRGGNREVVKFTITTQLKMEDVCVFYNVIEAFRWKKVIKVERWGPSSLVKL